VFGIGNHLNPVEQQFANMYGLFEALQGLVVRVWLTLLDGRVALSVDCVPLARPVSSLSISREPQIHQRRGLGRIRLIAH